jgi:hypothetical protein
MKFSVRYWSLLAVLLMVAAVPTKADGFIKHNFSWFSVATIYKLTAILSPEPSSLILLGMSGLALVGLRNRRKSA